MWTITFLFLLFSYQTPTSFLNDADEMIAETLQKETRYFCERNVTKWKDQWSQQPFVSKMYIRDGEAEIYSGWDEIERYTVEHIRQNPNPIPIPDTDFEYDIYLFGETAWVFYHKTVDDRKISETRFMVKEGEKWKIARMQTIYQISQK